MWNFTKVFTDEQVKKAIPVAIESLIDLLEEYARRTATPVDDAAVKVLKELVKAYKV